MRERLTVDTYYYNSDYVSDEENAEVNIFHSCL